jgi:hypothetical protein
MILISDENGSAIYIASSPRRIHEGPSVIRGRFPRDDPGCGAYVLAARQGEHRLILFYRQQLSALQSAQLLPCSM